MKKLIVNSNWMDFSIGVLGFIIAFAMLITIRPYFTWESEGIWGRLSVLFFVFSFSLTVILKFYESKVVVFKLMFILVFVGFLVSMEVPFREYDTPMTLGSLIVTFIPIFFILCKDKLIEEIYKYIYILFFIICIASLFNLALYSLGLIVPYERVYLEKATFYKSGFDYYTLAPVLAGQYFDVGVSLYRNNGWFYEPGHFACYLSFILALQKNPFKGKANKLMLITLLSTFSGVAFLFLFLFYVFNMLKNPKYVIYLLVLVVFTFFLIQASDEISFIVETYVYTKFSGSDTLEERKMFYGPSLFDISLWKLFFGYGSNYTDVNDWQLSDFTNHIYSYGLLSFLYFVSSLFVLFAYAIKKGWKVVVIFTFIFVLVLMHRHFLAIRTFSIAFFCYAYVVAKKVKDEVYE